MKTINIHAARAQFSGPVEEAAAGEEIIIARAGKPTARLVAIEKPRFGRAFGALKGRIRASEDFDAPLPSDILTSFGLDQ